MASPTMPSYNTFPSNSTTMTTARDAIDHTVDQADINSAVQATAKAGGTVVNAAQVLFSRLVRAFYNACGVPIKSSNAESPVDVYRVQASEADVSPVYFRSGALKLLGDDALLLLKQSWTIPLIFYPPAKFGPKGGKDVTWLGGFAQFLLVVASLFITFFSLTTPVFLVLWPPGILLYVTILRLLDGKLILESKANGPVPPPSTYEHEAWLCANGIGTSKSGLQLIINYLHTKFGRPVTGIYNKTFGIWFDLVECMLQRDLQWPTQDVNLGYKVLSEKITNPNLKRVVLFAHSQGGIITSIWVDQLLVDFPGDQRLKKLEIYTFASAGNHFSSAQAFGRVEHFHNTHDFVSRIGVGKYAEQKQGHSRSTSGVPIVEGRYEGTIFKRVGASGHLLLSNYFGEGQSILDDPMVRMHSWLQRYDAGANPAGQ